jgi:hypothetical protein
MAKAAASPATIDAQQIHPWQLSPHEGVPAGKLLAVSAGAVARWIGGMASLKQSQKPSPMFRRTTRAVQRAIFRPTRMVKSKCKFQRNLDQAGRCGFYYMAEKGAVEVAFHRCGPEELSVVECVEALQPEL